MNCYPFCCKDALHDRSSYITIVYLDTSVWFKRNHHMIRVGNCLRLGPFCFYLRSCHDEPKNATNTDGRGIKIHKTITSTVNQIQNFYCFSFRHYLIKAEWHSIYKFVLKVADWSDHCESHLVSLTIYEWFQNLGVKALTIFWYSSYSV